MPVVLQGCHTGFTTTPTITSGYVLIRLVVPDGIDGMLWDSATGRFVPCGQVYQAPINTATGCWTSDPVTCNSDLNPAGSYYEISTIVNNVCCGVELVQLDCSTNIYPNPTDVSTVTVVTADPTGSTLICQAVAACLAGGTGAVSNLVEIGGDEGPVSVFALPSTPVNFPLASTLQAASAVVGTAPTGADLIFDVLYGPSLTVLTTGTIADGAMTATFTPFIPQAIVGAIEWLEVRVTQIGSVLPGEELTVTGLLTY